MVLEACFWNRNGGGWGRGVPLPSPMPKSLFRIAYISPPICPSFDHTVCPPVCGTKQMVK